MTNLGALKVKVNSDILDKFVYVKNKMFTGQAEVEHAIVS